MKNMKEELASHPIYKLMESTTKYMDRYYIDPILSILPAPISATVEMAFNVTFLYFTILVARSIPLTLAIIVNTLVDMVIGAIPYIGVVLDIVKRSYRDNFNMITGYMLGDQKIVHEVKRKCVFSVLAIVILLIMLFFAFQFSYWALHHTKILIQNWLA